MQTGRTGGTRTRNSTTVQRNFSLRAPAASTVMLAADFTHWQERAISLRKGRNGVWTATVSLEPGTYHYRFIVDGEGRDEPNCTMRVPEQTQNTQTGRHRGPLLCAKRIA